MLEIILKTRELGLARSIIKMGPFSMDILLTEKHKDKVYLLSKIKLNLKEIGRKEEYMVK
jgi:hypothetical protein